MGRRGRSEVESGHHLHPQEFSAVDLDLLLTTKWARGLYDEESTRAFKSLCLAEGRMSLAGPSCLPSE